MINRPIYFCWAIMYLNGQILASLQLGHGVYTSEIISKQKGVHETVYCRSGCHQRLPHTPPSPDLPGARRLRSDDSSCPRDDNVQNYWCQPAEEHWTACSDIDSTSAQCCDTPSNSAGEVMSPEAISVLSIASPQAHPTIMAALWNRAGHYIFILWFLSIFFFFSSPNLNGRRMDVCYTSTNDVILVQI